MLPSKQLIKDSKKSLNTMQIKKILLALTLLLPTVACQSSAAAKWEAWDADDARGKLSRKLDIRWKENKPTTEFKLEGSDAVAVRATVNRVVNDIRKEKVIVFMDLANEMAEHLHFDLNDTRLIYQGEEYVAKDAELWRQDPQPDVVPGATKLKVWAFEIGGAIDAGKYDLVIRNMKSGGPTNGDTVLSEEWTIEIKVPGPYKDGPQS